MDLLGTVPRRYGAINALADLNPEYVVGLRALKTRVWFADSNNANTARDGKSWDSAMLTIQAAVDLATVGDVILVAAGHVETVVAAAGLNINKAGLTLVGLGNGNYRPQINFTTLTTATMTVTAANVTMRNFRFTGGVASLVAPIAISAADCTLQNIITQEVTASMLNAIVTTAAADRLTISGWKHRGLTTAGAAKAISIVGGDGHVIEDFEIFGNFSTAAIENVTTAMTNARIGGGLAKNYIQNSLDNAAVVAVTVVSTSTGHIGPDINVRIGVDSTSNTTNITEALVGAAMQFFQPLNIANLGGEVAMPTNITAATDA